MTKENENDDEKEDEKTNSNIFYIFNSHFLIPLNACEVFLLLVMPYSMCTA